MWKLNLETNRCTCVALSFFKWDKNKCRFAIFLFLHFHPEKTPQMNNWTGSVIWAASCTVFNPSTFITTIISRLYSAFSCSDVNRVIHWAFWCNFEILTPLFLCKKKRKEKKAILFGISRNLSDPPQRALGCFYCTMFLVLGLLLSHSCTIGLIKQRTIRALSFNGLQVPLNHGAWMADSEPCLGFAKTTQKRWKSWRVFLFIALKCSILGQFWKVYWA